MPYIAIRDPLADAKDTLSSWDKCMAKSYCKWPVIVAIVVGSLIILSTVLCIVRCVCCGVKCATCCCSCCSCGSSNGDSGHKRMKSGEPGPYPQGYNGPPIPPPAIDTRPVQQQYRSHAAPTFNPPPEAPQYARFESPSKPVNEDALPAMPSYSEAKVSYVEDNSVPEKRGDMEMDRLDHNGSVNGTSVSGAAAVGAARRSPGRSPVQRSPSQDTYGFPPGYQNDSFVSAVPHRSPHSTPGPYNNSYEQQNTGYRGVSPVNNLSPVYGAGAGYGQNQQYGRASPAQGYNNQYGQPAPRRSPAPPSSDGYNDYGYGIQDRSHAPVEQPQYNNYAPAAAVRSPSPEYYPSVAPARSESPGYAPTGSTRYEPQPSYPAQQTYAPSESSYPGQQTYQAFQPQESGIARKQPGAF